MSKIVIESSNKNDTITSIEEKLEKAYTSMVSQRERKQFSDDYLKQIKDNADKIVNSVFNNMVDEIAEILNDGR